MSKTHKVRFDTELLHHIKYGRNDEAKLMLTRDLATASDGFGTLLHYAAKRDNKTIVQYLIELNSKIDAKGVGGKIPLMLAVKNQHVAITQILLEAGANFAIVDAKGQSTLQMAFRIHDIELEILQALVRKVRTVDLTTEKSIERLFIAGCTLHHAVLLKDVEILKGLLQHGCDVNLRDAESRTALHMAVRENNFEMAKILTENGADVNALDQSGTGPLIYAAGHRNLAAMRVLLERGANPNTKNPDNHYSPLLAVLGEGKIENLERLDGCVAILLQHGAIPQNERYATKTLFDYALDRPKSRAIDHLIAHLAMIEMIGKEAIVRYTHVSNRSKIVQLKENYQMCQRILEITIFEKLSLLDLLIGCSDYEMRLRARNQTFVSQVQDSCSKSELKKLYFYYYDTLMMRVDKAVRTVELENRGMAIICDIFKGNHNVCYVVAREIVSYLSQRDLTWLCEV